MDKESGENEFAADSMLILIREHWNKDVRRPHELSVRDGRLELRINPWLYRGVRDEASGKLDSNWYPAPPELAQIDHQRYQYAIAPPAWCCPSGSAGPGPKRRRTIWS
jgi:hypothetical protein